MRSNIASTVDVARMTVSPAGDEYFRPELSDLGTIVFPMSGKVGRIGVIVSINADSDMTVGDAESLATKSMEIVLRECGISWGPGIHREFLSFGPRTVYVTVSPSLIVDVDTIVDASCSMATVRTEDAQLTKDIYESATHFAREFQLSGCFVTCGRSHPRLGHMTSQESLDEYSEELMRRRTRTESWIRTQGHETVVTDENGETIDVPEQSSLFEFINRACRPLL